jgi:hypothetical protein
MFYDIFYKFPIFSPRALAPSLIGLPWCFADRLPAEGVAQELVAILPSLRR